MDDVIIRAAMASYDTHLFCNKTIQQYIVDEKAILWRFAGPGLKQPLCSCWFITMTLFPLALMLVMMFSPPPATMAATVPPHCLNQCVEPTILPTSLPAELVALRIM